MTGELQAADECEKYITPPERRLLPSHEEFQLTLSLGGRYAGEQVWQLHSERGALVARVQTDFGGVLPAIRRVQQSRLHPRSGASVHYSEGDGRGRPSFETGFDKRSGTMTLRQGRDEASAPLTTEHHDPVSLLLWLRTLGAEDRASAWLTGGRALIQRLPDSEIGGELGAVACYTYFLRPGNAYVYVEQAAPYRLMRLIQPTDFGAVEANLGLHKPKPSQDRQRRRRGS